MDTCTQSSHLVCNEISWVVWISVSDYSHFTCRNWDLEKLRGLIKFKDIKWKHETSASSSYINPTYLLLSTTHSCYHWKKKRWNTLFLILKLTFKHKNVDKTKRIIKKRIVQGTYIYLSIFPPKGYISTDWHINVFIHSFIQQAFLVSKLLIVARRMKCKYGRNPVLQEFTHSGWEDVLIENEKTVKLNALIENRYSIIGISRWIT